MLFGLKIELPMILMNTTKFTGGSNLRLKLFMHYKVWISVIFCSVFCQIVEQFYSILFYSKIKIICLFFVFYIEIFYVTVNLILSSLIEGPIRVKI